MKNWFNYLAVTITIFALAVFSVPTKVKAQENEPNFRTDYTVDYYLTEDLDKIQTKVMFTIAVTNLKPDLYVNKIGLAFPKQFAVNSLDSSDDSGAVNPSVTSDDTRTKIELTFNSPKIGRNTVNTFKLSFNQDNLFKINGTVWEVMLPTIEDKGTSNYVVHVHLPKGTDKKISIAKPNPDDIQAGVITWNNPKTKTIYAVFGAKQTYEMNLLYHLQNTKLVPVYTDVAFPPDTLYQKTYIKKISPQPDEVFLDEDGNYMGRYILKSKEKKDIVYEGTVVLFTQPREELIPLTKKQFDDQKAYLLSPAKHWSINENQIQKDIGDVQGIYSQIVKTLTYDYRKLTGENRRMGASEALSKPDQAVCVEYTDAFIAIAREKGIYARELQGYGFSNDPQLRPLSLNSDVLHSWPEFYDPASGLWRPVDPTWEDTSGIDYFNSLDLNHIVFTIHGKNSDYPLPAGMYKTAETKDVSIRAITEDPTEDIRFTVLPFSVPSQITDQKSYEIRFTVENKSNVYLWNIPIQITGENISTTTSTITVPALAPYQKKELKFEYKAQRKYTKATGKIKIAAMNNPVFESSFSIMPYHFQLALKIAYGVLSFSILFLLFKYGRRLRKK